MGHGDEIIFLMRTSRPTASGHRCCADGLQVSDLLRAVIPLFELDSYAPPLVMMAAVEGATRPAGGNALSRRPLTTESMSDIVRIDRFAFYERAQKPCGSLSQANALSTGIFF
ncbi:L-fucose mutarotase [Raoultella planticola]|nr:L-fucose mutarotase [Raoultella planticola]